MWVLRFLFFAFLSVFSFSVNAAPTHYNCVGSSLQSWAIGQCQTQYPNGFCRVSSGHCAAGTVDIDMFPTDPCGASNPDYNASVCTSNGGTLPCQSVPQTLVVTGSVSEIQTQVSSGSTVTGGCNVSIGPAIPIPGAPDQNNCQYNVDGSLSCQFVGTPTGVSASPNIPGASIPTAPTPTGPTSTTSTNNGAGTTSTSTTSTFVNPDGTTTTTTTTATTSGGTTTTSTSSTTTTNVITTGIGTGTGGGNGTGTGTGNGAGTGAGDCDPTATNYLDCILGEPGTAPGHPQGEANSFGEAASAFAEGVAATPIGQLATSLSSVIPAGGGQCPTPGFDIFGQHFSIDMHCTLYSQISGMLSSLMIVVFSIMGIRIILSS